METEIYNQEGELTGKMELPEDIFGLPWNGDLVHQVIVSMQANKRAPIAHTKNRGEVSGTGKKPWRQKGTGRARHGSRRSPIWVGGGVAHGPRNEKNYGKKINEKMKKKAFLTILSQKFRDSEVLFVDKINLEKPKTKEANLVLNKLSAVDDLGKLKTKRKNKAILATEENNLSLRRSFRNIPGMAVMESRNLSPLDLMSFKYLIIDNPQESLKKISK